MVKLVLFGGAFDPVHVEHQSLYDAVVKELSFDELIIIPSYNPPHKTGGRMTDFEDRVNMLRIAFPDAVISDYEYRSGKKNYTYETLKRFKTSDNEIYYVIGGDSMADFMTWYKPLEIIGLATLVVCHRTGRESDAKEVIDMLREQHVARIIELTYEGKDVSSTLVRYSVALNENISDKVPEGVERYICEHHLYEDFRPLVDKVKSIESEKTFNHSKNVALTALKLNAKLKLDNDKVFLAALLHDVAKYDKGIYAVPEDSLDTPVEHQFAGSEKVKTLGITDEDVINAIRYHTTGKPEMTTLEKLIYLSDMISYERDFDGVDELRRIVDSDFEEGFKACLKHNYDYLIETKAEEDIYPLTVKAYNYYIKEKSN